MYGSDAPPKYNLSQVTAATSIYYGAGDIISTKAVNFIKFYNNVF